MKEETDIRWKQRFSNYQKALRQLDEFLEQPHLNKFEEQGLIKSFEYTYELGWNTLKDFFAFQGAQDITGSRDAFRKAFSTGLIEEGKEWMRMIESRNQTTHTYNEAAAQEIVNAIRHSYHRLFHQLEGSLKKRI